MTELYWGEKHSLYCWGKAKLMIYEVWVEGDFLFIYFFLELLPLKISVYGSIIC